MLSAVLKPVSWRSSTACLPPHTQTFTLSAVPFALPLFLAALFRVTGGIYLLSQAAATKAAATIKHSGDRKDCTHTSSESDVRNVLLKQMLGKLNLHADTITIRQKSKGHRTTYFVSM